MLHPRYPMLSIICWFVIPPLRQREEGGTNPKLETSRLSIISQCEIPLSEVKKCNLLSRLLWPDG